MSAIPFDTLKLANQLKAVGFTDNQAETIVEIQREASNETLHHAIHDFHLDDIATKMALSEVDAALRRDIKEMDAALRRDIKDMETRLQHQIELLRADTGRQIAETKADLTRWIIGAGFLQTSLIIGVLLKIAHLI